MHAERDHLVRFVFPRLREELLKRRVHLIDVDLRWGVTSEQDALGVCREIIDECRPRFICILGGRYGWTPPGQKRSITEDEVHYAALDRSGKTGYHFFYFRDPQATESMVEPKPGDYREPEGTDNYRNLEHLKQSITDAGLTPFIYNARWDDSAKRLVDLKRFGDEVYTDVMASIDSEYGADAAEAADEFTEQNSAMESFIEEKTTGYVIGSRQDTLDKLSAHAQSKSDNGYLCLSGESGIGKSALMAQFCRSYRDAHPDQLVIPHFVGIGTGSTDVRQVLRRLCHELSPDADIPEDYEELRKVFPEYLSRAGESKHIVILLDAVNQLDQTNNAHSMRWLPDELPSNVRIIVSAMPGPALDAMIGRQNRPEIELLPAMEPADAEEIIKAYHQRYRKNLTVEQRAALLSKSDSRKPLYLLTALEELRTLGTYEEITARITELPQDTESLFLWILGRLEADPGFRNADGLQIGEDLVCKMASCLGVSRRGLSQAELVEIIAPGDPQGNLAALLYLLRPYLMQRGELLDFYHAQFRSAVESKYLAKEHDRLTAHRILAEHFGAQDYFLEPLEMQRRRTRRLPHTPRPANARKVLELPWQLLQIAELSREWNEVEELFTHLPFLEAKAEAGLVYELVDDFSRAADILPEDRSRRLVLLLLEECIRREIGFLAEHPTALFQSIWNNGWWYDAPAAASHYSISENSEDCQSRWERPGQKLYQIIENWRQARDPSRPWLRSLRPPPVSLYGAPILRVQCRGGNVNAIAASNDGRFIAAGSADGELVVWDAHTGSEVQSTKLGLGQFTGLFFDPHDAAIIGVHRNAIVVWDPLDLGRPQSTVMLPEREISVALMSSDGMALIVAFRQGPIQFLDYRTGCCTFSMEEHTERITSLAVTKDGTLLAGGSFDGSVILWDMSTGRLARRFVGHHSAVLAVAFTADEMGILSGGAAESLRSVNYQRMTGLVERNRTIRLWSLDEDTTRRAWRVTSSHLVELDEDDLRGLDTAQDGQVPADSGRLGLQFHRIQLDDDGQPCASEGSVTEIVALPDGHRIAAAVSDGTVRIWDLNSGRQIGRLSGTKADDEESHVAVYGEGSRILASIGGSVMSANATALDGGYQTEVFNTTIEKLQFAPDGSRVALGGNTGTADIWNVKQGLRELRLPGHSCICEGPEFPEYVDGFHFSRDGTLVAVVTQDNLRLWSIPSGSLVSEVRTGEEWEWYPDQGARVPSIVDVIIAPDAEVLVTLVDTHVVSAWAVATGERILRVADVVGNRGTEVVGFSADGSRLVVTKKDHLMVVNVATGEELFSCAKPPGVVCYRSDSVDPDLVFCRIGGDGYVLDLVGKQLALTSDEDVAIVTKVTKPRVAGDTGSDNACCASPTSLSLPFDVHLAPLVSSDHGRLWAGANGNSLFLLVREMQ